MLKHDARFKDIHQRLCRLEKTQKEIKDWIEKQVCTFNPQQPKIDLPKWMK